MDSLTHIALGAAIGDMIAGKRLGKRAMLYGALAGSAPDADAIVNFFVSHVDSIIIHRGITHSLFFAGLAGPALGWVLWALFGKLHNHLGTWIALVTLNMIVHDLIDSANVYGTALLTPFSDHRFAFDLLFVADPLFTVPLLISFILLLFTDRNHPSRKKIAGTGIIIASFYLLFTFFNHRSAVNNLNQSLEANNIRANDYFAVPTLFNSVLWYLVASDSAGYYVGYYSIFDTRIPELYFIPGPKPENIPAHALSEVNKLAGFSKHFYTVTESDGTYWFNNMRFGQINGWENPGSGFAFSFDLSPGADNSMVVQRGRLEGTKKEVIQSMWQRMKGN